MAKIAVELAQAVARRRREGRSGAPVGKLLAAGPGWTVEDVMCTSGPSDRPFEEQHDYVAIALVVAGSFQYRSFRACELMTPGSVMLGNPGQPFVCGHEHSSGDRCISFRYTAEYFEAVTAGVAGRRAPAPSFQRLRVPPVRSLSSLIARACARLEHKHGDWEELSVLLAGRALQIAQGSSPRRDPLPSVLSRVTRAVRQVESAPESELRLVTLAKEARLSPYHFLRTFQHLTGVTPHQYVRRVRLRAAATRLASTRESVLEIALDCGFGDVSNFNHAFRAEFGMSPRQFRAGA